MDDSSPSKLQVWRGWTSVSDPAGGGPFPTAPPVGVPLAGPAGESADRLHAQEALQLQGTRHRRPPGAEPYTLQWFLEAEELRYQRNGRWIPRILEFAKHSGERLLGVGPGLGTDWIHYARHGASVVVCNPSAEELGLVRRHFDLRGLPGQFLQAPASCLPIESAGIDVVCLNLLPTTGLESATADAVSAPVVEEVYRVLKPGGKVIALVPAQYDVDFWFGVFFPWQRWFRRPARNSAPPPPRYTARTLGRLFHRFTEQRVSKRHLRRAEIPHVWRWLPPALLARVMGRVLVLKAFKPLSAAMALHLAA
jgi:SAM-dependent methyltransferase